MVIRLSNKIGLKTLFMKEGEAAEGIIESLKKAKGSFKPFTFAIPLSKEGLGHDGNSLRDSSDRALSFCSHTSHPRCCPHH